ncbi:hypothetical protein EES37_20545 [Streptomyces sp. ADI91-18]|nr:hypothetical protein EES37_20545 [Streptomyces sp. ADI91-18]
MTLSSAESSRCTRRRAAWPRSASADRADSTYGSTGAAAPLSAAAPTATASGACSMIVWALVPLMPNEDTPARRGRPVCGHGVFSVSSVTAPSSQSTCGVGSSTCRVRGSTPCRIAMIILITPATPAAACVWPMLDLIEPSHSGSSAARSRP